MTRTAPQGKFAFFLKILMKAMLPHPGLGPKSSPQTVRPAWRMADPKHFGQREQRPKSTFCPVRSAKSFTFLLCPISKPAHAPGQENQVLRLSLWRPPSKEPLHHQTSVLGEMSTYTVTGTIHAESRTETREVTIPEWKRQVRLRHVELYRLLMHAYI